MKNIFPSGKIYVGSSRIPKANRGVFATKDVKKGELIETCPVILVPRDDVPNLDKSILLNYYFSIGRNDKLGSIALGFGSLYNHSYAPNATYKKSFKSKTIGFVAIRDIKKNEEITTNYNRGNPNDKSRLWIKSIPPFKKDL